MCVTFLILLHNPPTPTCVCQAVRMERYNYNVNTSPGPHPGETQNAASAMVSFRDRWNPLQSAVSV